MDILLQWGIPSAISGAIIGFCMWYFKRALDKRDQKQEQHTKDLTKLMLLILRDSRATSILSIATAKAVQRIPDAHCNGDMTEALKKAAEIQNSEKDFLMDKGIEHIFGD